MTFSCRQFSLSLVIALGLLLISGCNTTPEKPYTPPTEARQPAPPPSSNSESSQRQAQSTAGAAQQSSQQSSAATQSAQASGASAPPPRSSSSSQTPDASTHEAAQPRAAPDVEIVDIPLDENGNPIESDTTNGAARDSGPNTQSAAQSSMRSGQTAGGGGGPTPRSGAADAYTSGAARGGGPPPSADGTEAGPIIAIGAQTESEQLAALDKDLDGKLAKFDALMRRAREEAEQERAAGGGGSSGSYGGGYGADEQYRGAGGSETAAGGAGGQADNTTGSGHTPDISGTQQRGEYQHANAGPIPSDVANTRDDDIVARQLREAATRETDPVLREKLWDEYRKYKKGIGR